MVFILVPWYLYLCHGVMVFILVPVYFDCCHIIYFVAPEFDLIDLFNILDIYDKLNIFDIFDIFNEKSLYIDNHKFWVEGQESIPGLMLYKDPWI